MSALTVEYINDDVIGTVHRNIRCRILLSFCLLSAAYHSLYTIHSQTVDAEVDGEKKMKKCVQHKTRFEDGLKKEKE